MDLRFSGITKLTGPAPAIRKALAQAQQEKPLLLYNHTTYGKKPDAEILMLDGLDSLHFLNNVLNAHLEPEQDAYSNPDVFTQVKQDPQRMAEYTEFLEEIQGLADDAEEQDVPDGEDFKSLSELMEIYYQARKAQNNTALDGTPILDKTV